MNAKPDICICHWWWGLRVRVMNSHSNRCVRLTRAIAIKYGDPLDETSASETRQPVIERGGKRGPGPPRKVAVCVSRPSPPESSGRGYFTPDEALRLGALLFDRFSRQDHRP